MLRLRLIVGLIVVLAAGGVLGAAFAFAGAAGVTGLLRVLAAEIVTLLALAPVLATVLVATSTVDERAIRLRAPRDLAFARTTAADAMARWNDEVRSVEW